MALSSLLPFVGVLISGCIGGLTVWLALRKRLEEETLGRATRRTTALQLLTDEEFTLEQVRDECVAIDTLVELGQYKNHREHLRLEAARIKNEASTMLAEVRARRAKVEIELANLTPTGLEAVISMAYHGKRRAETQLKRTQLSRTEILKRFEAADAA
jgi:hypothetical protein